MFATKAYELVKEFYRSQDGALPPFDENGLRQIFEEMTFLAEQNATEQSRCHTQEQIAKGRPAVTLRHAALERNKQCVLAYLYHRVNRIRDMRWTQGSVIPESIRLNITERETQYFKNYSKILSNYMRSVSGDLENGMDLTQDMRPPKCGSTGVLVLKDWELDDESGEVIVLKKEAIVFLDDTQCEPLIKQGIVEKINAS